MKTVGSLFEEEPKQWGLRGDPFMWRELKEIFSQVPLPASGRECERLIRQAIVSKVVSEALLARFESTSKADKAQTARLLEKVVNEMKSRIAARTQRDTQRRKNALENSSLPAKLVDCRSNNVDESELFIVEGDSALGTAKLARDSGYQALLPIRGKILNVQKSTVAEMLANAECANIIQVVGGGSGRSFDLSSARYGKIVLMSDADVDGAHIRTLLLTLFFRYMRPLVEAGRVFAAVPPLHRVVIINPGSKPNEVVYTYSEAELNRLLTKLKQPSRTNGSSPSAGSARVALTTWNSRNLCVMTFPSSPRFSC